MNYEVSVNGWNVSLMLSNQVKLEVLEEEITELDTTDLKSNADLKKED